MQASPEVSAQPHARPRWRRIAALALAPAIVGIPVIAFGIAQDNMEAGRPFWLNVVDGFAAGLPLLYGPPAIAALVVMAAGRIDQRFRAAGWVIALLGALPGLLMAAFAMATSGGRELWTVGLGGFLLVGLPNAFVGLVYCLIAGVPWAAPNSARSSRVLPALIFAPLAIEVLALALPPFLGPDWREDTFGQNAVSSALIAYVVSAPAGALVWALLRGFRLPTTLWVVVPLFAAAVGLFALVYGWSQHEPMSEVALYPLYSLPVSLAYCLIAGVPWRRAA